jgi:peptidoglycan/xylan/chitin deacetylase (PgdA/CDA1 family)
MIKSSLMVATSRKYIIWNGKRNSGGIALTFDDGPDPVYTPKILDILKSYQIPATFFLVGSKIVKYHEIANRILRHGHEIGNHTYAHPEIGDMSKASLEYEIEKTGKVIEEYMGYKTSFFRPPKGIINLPMLRFCRKKLKIIMWSVDSIDFRAENSQTIVKNVNPDLVKSGDILLFHDKNQYTVEILPLLIDKFFRKGLRFLTVTDMLSI